MIRPLLVTLVLAGCKDPELEAQVDDLRAELECDNSDGERALEAVRVED